MRQRKMARDCIDFRQKKGDDVDKIISQRHSSSKAHLEKGNAHPLD